MKHHISFILTCFLAFSLQGQSENWLSGSWAGKLEVQGTELDLTFDFIINEEDELLCLISIPKQNLREYPADRVVASDTSMTLFFNKFAAQYEAKKTDGKNLSGVWKQAGKDFPLNLVRTKEVERMNRPQEPMPPFPYKISEVSIINDSTKGVALSGTLTVPLGEGPFPAVVLVSGSGPQNRDSEIFGHKPFWVMADYLSRNGVAVLRYDDRGFGASTGNFQAATTLDFALDAESSINYLQNSGLGFSSYGIIGHSEGGIIAPIVASNRKDVDFIILLAGPTVSGEEILIEQARLMLEAEDTNPIEIESNIGFSKKVYDLIKRTPPSKAIDYDTLKVYTKTFYDQLSEEKKAELGSFDRFYFSQSGPISSPWFRNFVTFDPKFVLEKVQQPILAIYGTKDLQVPPYQNVPTLEKRNMRQNNGFSRIEVIDGLNHLFQNAETGTVEEYGKLEETFDEGVLSMIVKWIYTL